ncbi:YdcF family protein [Verrucomicrobia bacterium]|nr:YdcF family protein [Verrucomicrobiota bacterium]
MLLGSLNSLEVLVQPLSLVWMACIGGAVFCWRRHQRVGMWWFAGIAVFMSLVGSGASKALLRGLESPYAMEGYDHVESADAVVVLGGGHHPSLHDLSGFNLNDSGDRIITGVDLVGMGKAPVLVLGGSSVRFGDEWINSAELLLDWASRQLPKGEVIAMPLTGNTHVEALEVKKLMEEKGWSKVIIVTSGYHAKRAHGVFTKEGIELSLIGCGFESRGVSSSFSLFPKTSGFVFFERFLHEKVGWLVYRLKGWI